MEQANIERRKHKRLNKRFPVHFRIKTTNKYGDTLSCDVSGGGIRVMIQNFIAPKTDFMLEFSINDFFQIISAVGKVVWTKKVPHSDRYQLGIEFKEIPSKVKEVITQFIEDCFSKL
ncbi:MAG: PilZ domain-containing protein [Candidatus Omnitrophica bacterium]|nr:PilZ domain-containing protein [Candidatus Omnitrophota bacterium]